MSIDRRQFSAADAIAVLSKAISAFENMHGRQLYNVFAQFAQQLQEDIRFQITLEEYVEKQFTDGVNARGLLPELTLRTPKKMRFIWDYFIFVYMSHKVQNIIRSLQPDYLPSLLYLRGSDYDLAIGKDGFGVGYSTTTDAKFQLKVMRHLRPNYNVLKALSPTDLNIEMKLLPKHLEDYGDSLSSIVEFSRMSNAGIFVPSNAWKPRIENLAQSVDYLVVYVSNRSKGLQFELEAILRNGLEHRTVLVVDPGRANARDDFFSTQTSLDLNDSGLYWAVNQNACQVDDPQAFERLLGRFPLRVDFEGDYERTFRSIEQLLQNISAPIQPDKREIPFHFELPLSNADLEEFVDFRELISEAIDASFANPNTANWRLIPLLLRLQVFFSLSLGDIERAAMATLQYGAFADAVLAVLEHGIPEAFASVSKGVIPHVQHASDIARTALQLGKWNDYSDRRVHASATFNSMYRDVYNTVTTAYLKIGEVHSLPDLSGRAYSDEEIQRRYQALLDTIAKARS
ncbi:MAG: hypothetical protein AAF437_04100 [Pseudomonadota bacterium]